EELAEFIGPAGVVDEAVDRGGDFAGCIAVAGAGELGLEFGPTQLGQFRGAIEDLSAQVSGGLGPAGLGFARGDHGVAEVFARGDAVVAEGGAAILRFCAGDPAALAPGKFSADVELVSLEHRQAGGCGGGHARNANPAERSLGMRNSNRRCGSGFSFASRGNVRAMTKTDTIFV